MRSASGSGEAARTCLKSWWTTRTRRRPIKTGRGRMRRRVGKVAEADHQVYISTP